MTLNDLLQVPYVPNGRLPTGADCYGLVRLARVHLFGKAWMPSFAEVDGQSKRAMTRAQIEWAKAYQVSPPRPGCVAFCWRGKLCTHAAIVVEIDGRPMILETDEPGHGKHGPRLVHLQAFERRFLKVVYYDD